jgi:ACT domain-containing protein
MDHLNEQEIRKIVEQAIRQLGDKATPANIESVVHETVQRLNKKSYEAPPQSIPKEKGGDRVIVTAFGKNSIGILAGLTSCIAKTNSDIIDLSQKILQEFFTIMLLIDISSSQMTFEAIKEDLIQEGEKFDLKVIVQHEQIFKTMHRI